MTMLYVGGAPIRANLINRSGSTPKLTVSPAVTGNGYANDGDASSPIVFTSIAADSYYRFTMNSLVDPTFEVGALSPNWIDNDSGAGASSITTGSKRSATYGLELVPGTGVASVYQAFPFTAKAGEWRKASAWVNPLSGSSDTRVYLYNTYTGNYYNGSAWTSTRTAAMSKVGVGTPGFVEITVTYQVESAEACFSDAPTIRWYIEGAANATSYVDDCSDVAGCNFVGVFGHNYTPRVTPKVQTSTDGSTFSTTVSTMTLRRPAFYSSFTMTYSPHWQLKLEGTPVVAPYAGEIVFGQAVSSATGILYGAGHTLTMPGMRQAGPTGRIFVYNYSMDATRNLKMEFFGKNETGARELTETLWGLSEQGRYPTIVVPDSTKANVYIGRLAQPVEMAENYNEYRMTMTLFGDPFPSVGL